MKTDVIESSGFRHYLTQLDTFLKENLGPRFYIQSEKDKQALTRWRSVQFSYKGKVNVDLLVSPYWKDQFEFYQFLQTTANKSKWVQTLYYSSMDIFNFFDIYRYTVFAAKWQVQFFKHRPPEVYTLGFTYIQYNTFVCTYMYIGQGIYSSSKGMEKQDVAKGAKWSRQAKLIPHVTPGPQGIWDRWIKQVRTQEA